MITSGLGRVGEAGGCPTIGAGLVSPAGISIGMIHPRRSFHFRSRLQCDELGAAGALMVLVAVQLSVLGSYLPPVLNIDCHPIRPRRSSDYRSRLPCERVGQQAH